MDDTERGPLLGERFDHALLFASRHHRLQVRKGTRVPYVAHLLQVAGLVLEAGGDEDLAIAALLHDAIEDDAAGDADAVRREIGEQFGARVLGIVEALTDADTTPKPPWQARKEAYLSRLRLETSPDILLVSCADKLHNVRSIIDALRVDGPTVWQRFNGGREGTLWYYRELRAAYEHAGGTPLLVEYARAVADLNRLVRTMPDSDELDVEAEVT